MYTVFIRASHSLASRHGAVRGESWLIKTGHDLCKCDDNQDNAGDWVIRNPCHVSVAFYTLALHPNYMEEAWDGNQTFKGSKVYNSLCYGFYGAPWSMSLHISFSGMKISILLARNWWKRVVVVKSWSLSSSSFQIIILLLHNSPDDCPMCVCLLVLMIEKCYADDNDDCKIREVGLLLPRRWNMTLHISIRHDQSTPRHEQFRMLLSG